MRLTVVVPAYNEAEVLPQTLDRLRRCAAAAGSAEVELVVVDNGSTDDTARVATAHGARVVAEPSRRGVGPARNAGAAATEGDALVFVDADVALPDEAIARIAGELEGSDCIGGAFDTDYRPRRRLVRLYLGLWRLVSRATHMAQGACQFCTREAFDELGGYDERFWMGEDGEFWWRLRRLARRRRARVEYVRDLRVVPSCRRFDQWPVWRTLLMTNPFFTAAFARTRRAWATGWYEAPPR
jgi:glycosyltransferase involved in cell wall biosynthesis